jgi:uncharacterized cofD-like protein
MSAWPPEVDQRAPELRDEGPNVVAVGGGHGMAMVVAAATNYAKTVTGVVTVADDGGSSGRLTTARDILPPGDMRRGLLALSPEETVIRKLFSYRFTDTDVAGHSLGNLMLAALTDLLGDFEAALLTAGSLLGARGRILPVCRDSLELAALIDGNIIEGQAAITATRGELSQLVLRPPRRVNPDVALAIAQADQIVLGPGSLFTSVLSCLAVPGMVEAIEQATARIVYVLNLAAQDGETWGMSGVDHVMKLLEFSGLRRGGTVLAQSTGSGFPEAAEPVVLANGHGLPAGWDVCSLDLVDRRADWPQHDPTTLAEALGSLL